MARNVGQVGLLRHPEVQKSEIAQNNILIETYAQQKNFVF